MTSLRFRPGVTWFDERRPVRDLVERKNGRRVSVVVPALNEAATIAGVLLSIRPLVGTLVDELVVMDSGSIDDTVRLAEAAGATAVYTVNQVLPDIPPRLGKGEALWRSLAVTSGDLIVFIDSDLLRPSPLFVPSLLAPLLVDDGIELVKGYYRRPLAADPGGDPESGGRVTQLVARPLLTALAPELGEVLQPLGGEYAATRKLLNSIAFAPGYGVEIGILLDTWQRYGAPAIAQVDLGVRMHRNRPTHELADMSRQLIATLLDRLGIRDSALGLARYQPEGSAWHRTVGPVSLADRPPMDSVAPVGEVR